MATLDHARHRTGFPGHPPAADPARGVHVGARVSVVGDPSAELAVLPVVGVVEDDPAVAALAAELCRGLGANPSLFRAATPFLEACSRSAPRVVVLDWRLEREVGAAAFLAIRHRFPTLPVVCWTGSPLTRLPEMIHFDPRTRVVDKAAGPEAFEAALLWALSAQ